MYAKTLSKNVKAKRYVLIRKRDYPDGAEEVCMFCKQPFLPDDPQYVQNFDHLDNDHTNQQLSNLVLVHARCNQLKKTNTDLQILAQELIKTNQEWENNYDFALLSEKENTTDSEELTPTQIQKQNLPIVEKFLADKLSDNSSRILLSEAVNTISYRCLKGTGYGSPQSTRRYLNVLACGEAIYEIREIDGKKYILRRFGQ